MSGFVRTLEKRMLKRMGYTRQKARFDDQTGIVRLRKGEGEIIAPDGSSTGARRWPRLRDIEGAAT